MTEVERRNGVTRENAMAWAMSTAVRGEDPLAIISRAQLYEEYILGFEGAPARDLGRGPLLLK